MSHITFEIYHKSGVRVEYAGSAEEVKDNLRILNDGIDLALIAGYCAERPTSTLKPMRTAAITGWVFGLSNKEKVPLVWLYSDSAPNHKVAQVYKEQIANLPIGFDWQTGSKKPFPSGMAPQKVDAKSSGFYNECAPFTILLEDSGEDFEGHDIYRFVRVIDAQPPAVAENGVEKSENGNPFDDPNAGATTPARRLQDRIEAFWKDERGVDGCKAVTAWILKRYTSRQTPDNIRTAIDKLTSTECDEIWNALLQAKNSFLQEWAKQKSQPTGK